MPVNADLTFLDAKTDNPSYSIPADGGPPRFHGNHVQVTVPVRNARRAPDVTGLEKSGFDLVRHESRADFTSDTKIEETYYPEMRRLVRETTGAARVFVIDHTLRSTAQGHAGRGAVRHAHNDYTPRSIAVFSSRLAETFGLLPEQRMVQLNLWRPLDAPVRSCPLALADGRTVRREDLIACTLRYPDRSGEMFETRYHPGQKWYWFPEMRCDEVLIFKGHDTAPGKVRFVPHTAFDLPDAPADAPPRQSIELRVIAFFDAIETKEKDR